MHKEAENRRLLESPGDIKRALYGGVLDSVQKPGRYAGGELGAIGDVWDGVEASMLLAFPDAYEVGMSYLGFKILYDIINSHDGWRAERAYSPWPDMERAMAKAGIPLYGLESLSPAKRFDAIGVTLQYELSYTNVLGLIELSGLALKSAERLEMDPLVIAGGSCAVNPEPMAPFFDAFLIGDGEEAISEIMGVLKERRAGLVDRAGALKRLSSISGMYVPSVHDPSTDRIRRRILKDLGDFPASFRHECIPLVECVHDRAVVEVMRGCDRGCRFCQAGYINRPVRERKGSEVAEAAMRSAARGGYDEVSLLSLSTADYSAIGRLADALAPELRQRGVALSLPSLRIDAFSIDLAKKVGSHRRTGLTFAPEAGTQRMRDVINKGVTEEDLMAAARAAFESGWEQIKLYFMIGLPYESQEDVQGIADLTMKVLMLGRDIAARNGRPPSRIRISVSVGTLIPKPHTPFQWLGLERPETVEAKKSMLRGLLRRKDIALSVSDGFTSKLEALLSRGGRGISEVILRAYRLGARFDGWGECIMPGHWLKALADEGLDLEIESSRSFSLDERLPWGHIDTGVDLAYFREELERARRAELTPDCREGGCTLCGVCIEGIGNMISGPEV
ncbi:MAG TPA: TIGR03960 family B12-binding radical SAM protein [Bacillota bacterium]|nr:TIGR03960 family B12-binding radical SAM protein [Bacillota bacterium]HOA15895.1 TIGR03960 family B12-binding radical SAM protein [Bacillota bacterium]HOG53100.1 TIGR03960 family B12-binding radical SAM protein [Bacillota bacterium]